MKNVKVMIERAKDGTYSAYMDDVMQLPYSLNGVGSTVEEAIADWNACYAEMKQFYASKGEVFEEASFTYAYDVPSFLLYYAGKFTYSGLAKVTGVSAAQLSQYAQGYRNPSARTTAKIQNALHSFGAELSRLQLV